MLKIVYLVLPLSVNTREIFEVSSENVQLKILVKFGFFLKRKDTKNISINLTKKIILLYLINTEEGQIIYFELDNSIHDI